jgi:hypothetical protein
MARTRYIRIIFHGQAVTRYALLHPQLNLPEALNLLTTERRQCSIREGVELKAISREYEAISWRLCPRGWRLLRLFPTIVHAHLKYFEYEIYLKGFRIRFPYFVLRTDHPLLNRASIHYRSKIQLMLEEARRCRSVRMNPDFRSTLVPGTMLGDVWYCYG